MVRREEPTASSSAALANSTVPSPRTTATSVASRSKDWKRGGVREACSSPHFAAEAKPLPGGRAAAAAELALEAGDVFFIAFDVRLQLGDAVQVLLVVAVFGAQLLGLAVVVFLLQVGQARLGLLQFRFEDSRASPSRAFCSPASTPGDTACGAVATRVATAAGLPPLTFVPCTTVTLPPSTELAVLGLRFGLVVGVRVAAAVDRRLRKGRQRQQRVASGNRRASERRTSWGFSCMDAQDGLSVSRNLFRMPIKPLI
jgi:hypothetical protein